MEKETALKILRELHDKVLFSERTALETFIPELSESEDERIRKAIIELVEDYKESSPYGGFGGLKWDKLLAWLEKQGMSAGVAKKQGAKPLMGYQLRYVYFIDKASRAKLTVTELPYSAIDEMGAGLYKNEHISREERHKKCDAQIEREQRKQHSTKETENN